VSFGATRELAFLHATTGSRLYFPQTNNGVFTFGRDVNIRYKHGINALPEDHDDTRGRISIILWGKVEAIEEAGSPAMLGTDGKGPHANHNKKPHYRKNNNKHKGASQSTATHNNKDNQSQK